MDIRSKRTSYEKRVVLLCDVQIFGLEYAKCQLSTRGVRGGRKKRVVTLESTSDPRTTTSHTVPTFDPTSLVRHHDGSGRREGGHRKSRPSIKTKIRTVNPSLVYSKVGF